MNATAGLRWWAFVAALAAWAPQGVAAQPGAVTGRDSAAIRVEAARLFLREMRPRATVALDSHVVVVSAAGEPQRDATGAFATRPMPAAESAAIRAAVPSSAPVTTFDAAGKRCEEVSFGGGRTSRVCQFRDFTHLLTFGSIHVAGDTARVWVRYIGKATEYRPADSGGVELHNMSDTAAGWIVLVRERNEWRATGFQQGDFR